jgi:hypothetical protein
MSTVTVKYKSIKIIISKSFECVMYVEMIAVAVHFIEKICLVINFLSKVDFNSDYNLHINL